MDNLENVEDLTSLWNFDESIDDLRKQLQYVTNELAEVRKEAREQSRINKENVKKLIHLLRIAYKERDEANDQLRRLLMVKSCTLSPSSSPTPPTSPPPPPPPPPPITNVTNKSGLTFDSKTAPPTKQEQPKPLIINNFSWNLKTHSTMSPRSPLMMKNNNNSGMSSHSNTPSSSMDSYFDVGSSPDSYNIDNNNFADPNCASSCYDPTSAILDKLAKGRPRPEKGKLLQSVIEAGPTLDSLLVAGSLPEWMNPPQLVPAPQIPLVPISMCKRPRYNECLEY